MGASPCWRRAGACQLNPNIGEQGQSLTAVISGQLTHFAPGVTTAYFGAGITTGIVTVNGPGQMSVPITIYPWAGPGPRSVVVTTGSEVASITNGFTVLAGTPAITVIDPNVGQIDRTVSVNITGQFTNWQHGVTVVSFGPGVSVGGAARVRSAP